MRGKKYWIIVTSKDHVKKGQKEGFAQACHGKMSPLKRMNPGDYIIYYSGKENLGENKLCQKFTAIGKVKDEEAYQYQMTPDFCPARRNIDFFPSNDIPIKPLIEDLQFIKNKEKWGYPFRFGILEINKFDFELISSYMLKEKNG